MSNISYIYNEHDSYYNGKSRFDHLVYLILIPLTDPVVNLSFRESDLSIWQRGNIYIYIHSNYLHGFLWKKWMIRGWSQ